MASFDYAAYAATVAAAQNGGNSGVKVSFFKLADGAEALVRFDVHSLSDLEFASIHRVKKTPEEHWPSMSVSCLNPLGKSGECPLCAAVDAGDDRVQKVGKKVFVKMLVSYKDANTGAWGPVTPVVWERPAGFYKELMAKINDYGDLTQHLFKLSRSGTSLDTRYTINYAVPAVYKPDMIPVDFSAFNGFDMNKHAFWEKTYEECEEYLRTGSFPDSRPTAASDISEKAYANPTASALVEDDVDAAFSTPVTPTPAPTAAPVPQPAKPATSNNFGGFSF